MLAEKKRDIHYRNYPWRQLFVAFIVVFLLINLVIRMLDDSPEPEPRVLGIPIITHTYAALEQHSIDQIVESDSHIYILYGDHDGNVQVFDKDGEYQYSAYFYTHLNGAFSIAADKNMLYVRDERYNVYILQNGECVSFLNKESAGRILETVDFDQSSSNYTVRLGSVWRSDSDGDVCIIKRPLVSALYQNNIMFYASLILAVVIGLIFRRTKGNQ